MKRLKSTRTRLKRRTVVVLALATAGALAVAGVAVGAGNSTATINFTPVNLANPGFTDGKLFVKTTTAYTNPATRTRAAPRRGHSSTSTTTSGSTRTRRRSATRTTSRARRRRWRRLRRLAAPRWSARARRRRSSIRPGAGGPTNVVNGCVRIYNGQGTTSEVLIFTRVQVGVPPNNTISCTTNGSQGNVTVLLPGDLKAAGNVPVPAMPTSRTRTIARHRSGWAVSSTSTTSRTTRRSRCRNST